MRPVPQQSGAPRGYHRGLYAVAMLTAVAVFPLLFVGAGVTSKGAGMAYPDWPTSSGHLVNPPLWWQVDATRWEHGHRLLGWTVGMCAVLLAVLSWPRGAVRRMLGLAVLIAIGVQGVLGGMRVTEVSTELAMIHGIWGQVCFCLACAAALINSRSWITAGKPLPVPAAHVFQRLCLVGTSALFVQLILGAALRHFASDTVLLAHLLWAVVAALVVGWIVVWVIGQHPARDRVETLGWMLGLLMVVQMMLGGFAWAATVAGGVRSEFLQWAVPSAHVAVGALLLACSVLLTLCAHRSLRPAPDRAARPDLAPAATA